MSWNEIVEGFVLPLALLSSLCFLSLPCKIAVKLEQRETLDLFRNLIRLIIFS